MHIVIASITDRWTIRNRRNRLVILFSFQLHCSAYAIRFRIVKYILNFIETFTIMRNAVKWKIWKINWIKKNRKHQRKIAIGFKLVTIRNDYYWKSKNMKYSKFNIFNELMNNSIYSISTWINNVEQKKNQKSGDSK